MLWAILCLLPVSFALSWLITLAMTRLAPRIGFVDKPGHRKIHANPKPLGGGVSIFWAFALPLAIGLIAARVEYRLHPPTRVQRETLVQALEGGAIEQTPLLVSVLVSTFLLHLMGLLDDRKALGPYAKLVVQFGVTLALVLIGDLRGLTAMGYWPSVVVTILWITAVTNAFNFLDNMDGLSAGVAAVSATAFLVTTLSIHQYFVAAALALLLGALLGFLCFNFPPASIFMGDAGSLVVGFLLGVLTVRTTFLPPGTNFGAGWYAVFAPVIVLAVPLYDLLVVSVIRLRRGTSPFVGDTNHFSHRLVRRGMSRRTAVLCLYLVSATTGVSAIVLPHVGSTFLAILIFAQTLLILGVVLLLELHPPPAP